MKTPQLFLPELSAQYFEHEHLITELPKNIRTPLALLPASPERTECHYPFPATSQSSAAREASQLASSAPTGSHSHAALSEEGAFHTQIF